jgi:hypothetical protein
MSYQFDEIRKEIVISGFEDGIAQSPYLGIANMQNVTTHWYPGVAYINYRRQVATLSGNDIIDTYASSNFSANIPLYSGGSQQYVSQVFYNTRSDNFNAAQFYLSSTGSPSGNIQASLYSVTPSFNFTTINALVVGGGGGGGQNGSAEWGGGGGGQVVTASSLVITPQAYSITVGGGGGSGSSGSSSSIGSVLSAIGGTGSTSAAGGASGSGQTGGSGSNPNAGGGGGGDNAGGTAGSGSTGGNGGNGTSSSISGSSVTYGGGGGGAGNSTHGNGGTGGGGSGGIGSGSGTSGTANTGGGGGAGGTAGSAGSGGTGIVIISYPTGTISATGGTITTSGGNTIHTFTTSGTWTINNKTYYTPNASLVSSNTVAASTLTSTPTLTSFPFASTPLSANTYYFITINYGGGNVSNSVNVGYGITNEYSGNNFLFSTNGSLWTQETSPAVNNIIYAILPVNSSVSMANPVQSAKSPSGLNYILDTNGNVWKQTAVNSSAFSMIYNGPGRLGNGNGGIAYWNNYIIVFGDNLIEFCGTGAGDSTITGANWNVNTKTFPLNQQTFTAQQFQLSGTPSGTYTGGTLAGTNAYPGGTSANWEYATNLGATMILSTGQTITGCVFTNGSSTFTTPSTVITGSPSTLVFISSPGIYHATNLVTSGQQVTFSTTGTLPSPLATNTLYYAVQSDFSGEGGFTFNISTTPGGTPIILTTQGTGVHSFSFVELVTLPTGNISNMTFTNPLTNGATSATISSYTLPNGTSVNTYWLQPTGIYNLIDSNGNNISATFTLASSTVNFSPAISQYATGNFTVQILNPNVNSRAYVSQVDGNLYFINGQSMGALILADSNAIFNPGNGQTYAVQYSIFELGTAGNSGSDSIVDMVDLQTTMVVAGQTNLYTWDYTSSFTNSPVPIGEPIQRIKNLLNSIYITAGQKGNVYVSNGSYVQLMYKIPDYIAGAIDPVWTFGDLMRHRGKIYFQALAQNTSGINILAGIFSLIVSPAVTGEVASGLIMEAQNSYGLTPTSGTTGAGILIDAEPSSNGQDSYYSVYSTGSSSGGIDYNDTTVWQNFEPTIETDFIPIGTFLDKKTPGQVQFILDRPMSSGDQIELSWRQSLSDSYSTPVVTSTTTIANAFPPNISQILWIQFKINFKGASSNSSFIPLREVRVQLSL